MCMAEGNTSHGVTECDIISMKEALQAQQHLLQKLYAELDEEREASSTAASEALSMILRLQGEKAAVHMEASQYKRLAEEKICHAEVSMAIFEDIIYQKEMEIASLEFQIQAYKCKLLSLGCTDLGGASENRFPESLLFQGSNLCKGETSGNIRRLSSLPPIQLKDSQQKKSITEKESSTISIPDMVPKEMDLEVNVQSLNTEKKSGNSAGGNFNTYWEQIKMLDERVKEISCSKSAERDKSIIKSASRTCSLPLQESISKPCDPTRPEIITCLDKDNYHQQEEENASTSCSSNVHDIFEVPQIDEILITREHRKGQESKAASDVEDRVGKPDLVAHDTDELSYKDEADCLNNMLLSSNQESKLCKPRESVDCNVALVCPKIGVAADSQAMFQHLSKRMDRLEGERIRTRHEISYAANEEKQLLRDIREQLNVIQAEIHSMRPRKSPTQDDQPLVSLMEAMLHFWL